METLFETVIRAGEESLAMNQEDDNTDMPVVGFLNCVDHDPQYFFQEKVKGAAVFTLVFYTIAVRNGRRTHTPKGMKWAKQAVI